ENGNVHYSDQVPPEAKEVTVVSGRSPAPPRSTAAAAPAKQRTSAEMEAEFKKRRVEATEAEAKKQKEMADAAEKRKQCEAARHHVKMYEQGGRITRSGANGEQVFLDEKGIAEGLIEAKKTADAWCKS
ncbi:MAG: DUF4124 domain-containing protein, partial [Betaproteobacteria bacterium]|nr:DUF4124 domain-containing protein [Betaproteobacteria bacterium]